MTKKLLIFSILLIGLFVIGVVSASDNSTCDIADLKLNDDVIDTNQSQIDDNSNNDEVINAGDKGKFSELENKITSGSEDIITLDKDYDCSDESYIANSTFINNIGNSSAGALFVGENANIISSEFINNFANLAGAILSEGNLTINDTVFKENTGKSYSSNNIISRGVLLG